MIGFCTALSTGEVIGNRKHDGSKENIILPYTSTKKIFGQVVTPLKGRPLVVHREDWMSSLKNNTHMVTHNTKELARYNKTFAYTTKDTKIFKNKKWEDRCS